MTRCKKGDLAIVAGFPTDVYHERMNGRMVVCVELFHLPHPSELESVPAWRVEQPIRLTVKKEHLSGSGRQYAGQKVTVFAISDKYLVPIRPQPDDAVDEMVRRVGKPRAEALPRILSLPVRSYDDIVKGQP